MIYSFVDRIFRFFFLPYASLLANFLNAQTRTHSLSEWCEFEWFFSTTFRLTKVKIKLKSTSRRQCQFFQVIYQEKYAENEKLQEMI